MSCPGVCAVPASTEVTAKTTSPEYPGATLPAEAVPRLPAASRSPAKTREYASTIHLELARARPELPADGGSATC